MPRRTHHPRRAKKGPPRDPRSHRRNAEKVPPIRIAEGRKRNGDADQGAQIPRMLVADRRGRRRRL